MSVQLFDAPVERFEDWTHQFLRASYNDIMPNWGNLSYVHEKAGRVKRDTEYLVECIDRFEETGEIRWLAEYRWRLQCMVNDVDEGCWYAVAEGAR